MTAKTSRCCQKIFDGSARISANSSNANQNSPFQTVSFPFCTRVLPSSLRHEPRVGRRLVRPPGFEPGFLPYGCRSEAVRPVLAGLRRADARVPVLNQTRLRPLAPTEAHRIAKALRFRHFLQTLSQGSLCSAHIERRVCQSNRFDFLSCRRQYGHLGWYSVNEVLHFGQYQLKSKTTLVQKWDSRFQRFLCGCSFEALYESSWVQAFRAGFRAVEDRVTPPKSVL